MIRHIVSWRMGADRAEQRAADAEGVRRRLEALRGIVPAERIEVGIDLGATEGNWHVVLVSDFATVDDLAAYQTHPQHQQAAAFIRSVAADRSCVDYELPAPTAG